MPSFAQDSPFAGGARTETASRALQFGDPSYSASDVVLGADEVSAAASEGDDGDSGLAQDLSRALSDQLPEGVSLIAGEADLKALSLGQREASVSPIQSEEMDTEQAAEMGETMDRAQAENLGAEAQPSPQTKLVVHFPVAMENIPVSKYADVTAFVGQDGRVDVVRQRNLPNSLDAATASVAPDAAVEAAISDAGGWAAEAETDGPTLEVWVSPEGEGRLSYRIEFTDNGEEPQARRYWVAANGDAEVIYWESMIHHQHGGHARGTVWDGPGVASGDTNVEPLGAMTVSRALIGRGNTTTTDQNGFYAFTTGSGRTTVKSSLSGPHSEIETMAGTLLSRDATGDTSVDLDMNFNAGAIEDLAQTTAFFWTNRAYDLAKEILDPGDLPKLPTIVNRPGQCNAFWNGSSINFYRAGGNCPNMAYDSVVLHEYGHGVDARKGGIINGGYSEGFGDAMSIIGTRKSCVGADFYGPGTCLRDAKDLIMWPFSPGEGVHTQGRRYAGFVWELTQQLKNTYAEDTAFELSAQLVMGAANANPSDIPDAVRLSFIIDDDDGDLTNGTPHFKQLAAAADSRNLPRPADPIVGSGKMGFAWAHDPTSASYTPSVTYAHNSSGGAITATRSGPGSYSIIFRGLGGNGRAGGNVQVTGYGSSRNDCKVSSWSSYGADFSAAVRCISPSGALVDDRYTILVTWP
ncbi:hypothetical protein ACMA5I_15185 [Paracoccaceae bacterium GXU_MW_L88]